MGAVDGQGRNDGVHPGSVREPGIHHRRRVVDPAAHGADDAIDHLEQVPVALEPDIGALEPTVPLHVDRVGRVHQDVGDGRVFHEGLERPQPEDLVQDLQDQLVPLLHVQRDRLGRQQLPDQAADRLHDGVAVEAIEVGQIESLEEPAMDVALDVLQITVLHPVRAPSRPGRRGGALTLLRPSNAPAPIFPEAGIPSVRPVPSSRSLSHGPTPPPVRTGALIPCALTWIGTATADGRSGKSWSCRGHRSRCPVPAP